MRPSTPRRLVAWAFPIGFAALSAAALTYAGPGPSVLIEGAGAGADLLARAWPPTLDDPGSVAAHALETVWMALAGTALAAVLAVVLAPAAARNVCRRRWVRSAAMAVIVGCRAVPDVVFGIFFVAAIGIGPLPGVLALGLHSVGMLGRLFTEAIERTDDGVADAFVSTGAGGLRRLVGGVLPQVVPAYVGWTLYRLDINIRNSVVLGAVGAGGIGIDLTTAFGFTNYPEAIGISLVTVALVLAVEGVSMALRALLLGHEVPWRRARVTAHIAGWAGLVLILVAAWQIGAGPARLVSVVTGSVSALPQFWPPDFGAVAGILPTGIAEVAAIAVSATALGMLAGLPLGLSAARGALWRSRAVRWPARAVLVGLRSIPELLLLLLFVAAFGLAEGVAAATCGLAVFTTAFIGKLIADDAEELPAGTRQAVASSGAGPLAERLTWLFGHLTPTWIGNTLYALDINLRAFVILGVVGAGELGYALSTHMQALEYRAVTALVLPVFALVLALEAASTAIRGASK